VDNKYRWRNELKFDVTNYNNQKVYNLIKNHPLIFREHFNLRRINNVYFDNHNYQSFSDNIIGVSERIKTRIRWYGNTYDKIKNAKLELKIKNRELGRKEFYDIKEFTLNENTKKNEFYKYLIDKNIFYSKAKNIILKTTPILINTYRRRYFISSCKKFRITYDSDLEFYDFTNNHKSSFKIKKKILEIKFNQSDFKYFNNLTQFFPYRISKSSKYITGVELIKTKPVS
jgi:SPX domain protein involved in polyphosphate accumulation